MATQRTALDSISRLPESARDEVSRAIADGKTWRSVAVICAKHGLKNVTATNVTNYKQGKKHAAWQARQERIAEIRAEQDQARDIFEAARAEGLNPAEAACAVAARKVLSAVEGLDFDELLAESEEPGKLAIQIIRAATTLSSIMRKNTRTDRDASAESSPKGGGTSGITDEARKAIVDQVDAILGLKR